MTAGQGTPVDILMNSMGLLVLNDMDNIFAQLFILQKPHKTKEEVVEGEEEEEGDLLADGVQQIDIVFSKSLTNPHLLLVLFYALWFTAVFQFNDPEQAISVLVWFNPYSIIVFPVILFIWYSICYFDACHFLRCKCFF